MKLYKIVDVSVPHYPVVRLAFDDGFSGEVNFADAIGGGETTLPLRDSAVFKQVTIREGGRAVGWETATTWTFARMRCGFRPRKPSYGSARPDTKPGRRRPNDELRRAAEKQAALIALAS